MPADVPYWIDDGTGAFPGRLPDDYGMDANSGGAVPFDLTSANAAQAHDAIDATNTPADPTGLDYSDPGKDPVFAPFVDQSVAPSEQVAQPIQTDPGTVTPVGIRPGDSVSYSHRGNRTPHVQTTPDAVDPAHFPTTEDQAGYLAPGVAEQHNAYAQMAAAEAEQTRLEGEAARETDRVNREAAVDRRVAEFQGRKQTEAAWAQVKDIDPGHWWNEKSTAQKIGGTLLAAMGGWLSVSTGSGKNPALDAMMKMIDDDIRAQQVNQDSARTKAYRADRQVDKHLESLDLQRAARIESVKQNLIAEGAKYKSQFTQAKYMQMAGQLDQLVGQSLEAHAERQADFLQKNAQMEQQRRMEGARLAVQQRGQDIESDQFAFKNGLETKRYGKPGNVKPLELANVFDGTGYGVTFERGTVDGDKHMVNIGDSKVTQELNDAARKGTTVIQAVNRVLKAYKGGRALPGTQSRELVKRDMDQIMANYILSEGRGLSDSDAKAVQNAMGDPDPNRIFRLVSDETFQKKLLDFRNGVQVATENSLNRYQGVFGKVKFHPPEGTALVDPPDSRLTWPQLQQGLSKELAKFDKADPARIVGYLDAFGQQVDSGGLVLNPANLDFEGSAKLITQARDLALKLPHLDQDQAMLIDSAAAEALGKIAGQKAVDSEPVPAGTSYYNYGR